MLRYYLKLGLLSIRRTPILSTLMVAAIGTGIGACVTIMNIEWAMGANPIPHRSDSLFAVQVDNWDPYEAWEEPDEPPRQVTYRDGTALLAAERARRQVLSYKTWRVLQPADEAQRPFQVISRSTSADFFAMFDVPFLYGSGWDSVADRNEERVVVIDRETNETLFGGEDSVNRTLLMNGRPYRITGVLDDWAPMPKFYDLNNGAFDEPEQVFFPFSVSIADELSSSGNTNCWKMPDGTGWDAFRNSECVWMQFWVELHGAAERQDYLAFLDAYVEEQKQLGRFQRPLNNRLNDVGEWLELNEVVADDVRVLLGLAVLFLVVCLLNTIGLILAKVLRRKGDISLRRALGASRLAIFAQYIVEIAVIGLFGGLLGIALSWFGLQGIRALLGGQPMTDELTRIDWTVSGLGIALAVISALAASLYPIWRACGIQPAAQLKSL